VSNIKFQSNVNINDIIALAPFREISILLAVANRNPMANKTKIQKETKFSNGKFYKTYKSAKAMKLITNGYGIKLTDLGLKWMTKYRRGEPLSLDLTKEASLNVPLFNSFYNDYPKLNNPLKIKEIFSNRLTKIKPTISDTTIGASVRRYVEGIYGITFDRYDKFQKQHLDLREYAKSLEQEERKISKLSSALQIFIKELNLTNKEFIEFIDKLPTNKKTILISEWFSYLKTNGLSD
jgi:hypothetical protein